MLRIGLTGGIGSGKSTVARRLVAHGAVLVDSDVLAREVVAAGSDGLAAVVHAFGAQVLDADGGLDRPRLAAVVFGDPEARQRLNAIVHPGVRDRSAALMAAAPADSVVVQDIPLLVEGRMAAAFPLVLVVHADVEERVRRLVRDRGMAVDDARARIAAQADDDARRAAADVWLDNSCAPERLEAAVDALWTQRLVPFEENLRLGRAGPAAPARVAPDTTWPAQATRLAARVRAVTGGRPVEHIGPTAVLGLPAPDVLDMIVGVDGCADVATTVSALAAAGLVPVETGADGSVRMGSADPGRPVALQVLPTTTATWRAALVVRDWLRTDDSARSEYVDLAERGDVTAWWGEVLPRADAWAASSGWYPSLTRDIGPTRVSAVTEST